MASGLQNSSEARAKNIDDNEDNRKFIAAKINNNSDAVSLYIVENMFSL